jgi:tetratricopeptide repeat protein 8
MAAVRDRQVLYFDSSNVESIACLASHHFYTDQPEIALRFYRRLLQVRHSALVS